MRESTRQDLSGAMADVIGAILKEPTSFRSLTEIAEYTAYSPFHFSRCFRELTGESPGGFLRRIKLERAAFRLRSGERVKEVTDSESPESFCRAFKRAFGVAPRLFRETNGAWRLPSPHDLHWIPEWDSSLDLRELRLRYPTKMEVAGPIRLAVVEKVGNYAYLDKMWAEMEPLFSERDLLDRQWVTVYHDSMYTAPVSHRMRASLGFVCDNCVPSGFSELVIPRGPIVKTQGFVPRERRNEAWCYLSAQWPHEWSWDEYSAWPLPFAQVETRVCLMAGP